MDVSEITVAAVGFGRNNRGVDYISEHGINWMSGSTKRQCDRARPPRQTEESQGLAEDDEDMLATTHSAGGIGG
jgi:hypothetical protein